MSRSKAGQQSTGKRLTFLGPRNLVAWLESPGGLEVRQTIESRWLPTLAARVFDGSEESKAVIAEVLERHDRTTRCVVTIEPCENGKVWVKVYGPRELKAVVLPLPLVPSTVELQGKLEQLIEVELPKTFRPVFENGRTVASAILEPTHWSLAEWCEREAKKMADVEFSKVLDEVKKCPPGEPAMPQPGEGK